MKEKIIEQAVKNLKQFGYSNVNENNIFTDVVYSEFFKSMLQDNLGRDQTADSILKQLISDIIPQ